MIRRTHRGLPGATLIELMIVLTVLALLASLVSLGSRHHRAPHRTLALIIDDTRQRATRAHRVVTRTERVQGGLLTVTAHPDGSLLIDSAGTYLRFLSLRWNAE